MNKCIVQTLLLLFLGTGSVVSPTEAQVVETANGRVEGITKPSGVQVFKGIPYANPPVRHRRWKPPQPPSDWTGVRKADRFAPRCMQARPYGDMIFRSEGMSEDCLHLNVWTPLTTPSDSLPVLVYFYGGGFVAGDGSEPRYDGASMAQEGIVVVTLNYRLGVFGFLAHPALTQESPHNASGNYGLLDQVQALRWVRKNVEAFGGDPEQITIAGESAGSISVSAHMASPQSKDLFSQAIGESGALLGTLVPEPLDEAERTGSRFAKQIGADSLEELRDLSATRLLELASKPDVPRFPLAVDGHFFTEPPAQTYAAGTQADVPLLVGWNSEEMNYRALLQEKAPTPQNYAQVVRNLYGEHAEKALQLYEAKTWEEVIQVGTALASDRFIAYGTWKWSEMHRQTSAPVYRYYYTHPRPPMKAGTGNNVPGLAGKREEANRITPPRGAVHSAEIEYALGNLQANDVYAWTPEDRKVSAIVQGYFANFIKTGTPNGPGLPQWPTAGIDERATVMRLNADPRARPERHRDRYLFLDRISGE